MADEAVIRVIVDGGTSGGGAGKGGGAGAGGVGGGRGLDDVTRRLTEIEHSSRASADLLLDVRDILNKSRGSAAVAGGKAPSAATGAGAAARGPESFIDVIDKFRGTIGAHFGPLTGAVLDLISAIRSANAPVSASSIAAGVAGAASPSGVPASYKPPPSITTIRYRAPTPPPPVVAPPLPAGDAQEHAEWKALHDKEASGQPLTRDQQDRQILFRQLGIKNHRRHHLEASVGWVLFE